MLETAEVTEGDNKTNANENKRGTNEKDLKLCRIPV